MNLKDVIQEIGTYMELHPLHDSHVSRVISLIKGIMQQRPDIPLEELFPILIDNYGYSSVEVFEAVKFLVHEGIKRKIAESLTR